MLRFQVFRNGQAPAEFDLTAAYLAGADSIPIRADFAYSNGLIHCRKRAAGPAALSVLWPVDDFGPVILETTRLPERDEPYILNVELARGRMMRLLQKREDWGFMDQPEAQMLQDKANQARELLVTAITRLHEPEHAAALADQCLTMAIPLSEQAASVHADLLLQRRINHRAFSRAVFGCRADLGGTSEAYRRLLASAGEFVHVPMVWRRLHPQEHAFEWQTTDEWLDFLRRARLPAMAGPLAQFTENALPAWVYIWENDFETLRDLLYEHIERVVARYGNLVWLWNVVSGLHANMQFGLTFDQIMDVTRMSLSLVKKAAPNARTMIEIVQPWGEYYATNQRSIPPLVYAEMAVQSVGSFDLFGVQLCLGVREAGGWQRDLFQISSLLDRFAAFGKPLIVSAMAVPSEDGKQPAAGVWRRPWDEATQAKWVQLVCNLALSKPYVEAVCWSNLVDPVEEGIAHSGLVTADLVPKASFKTWTNLRRGVMTLRQAAAKAANAAS